MYKILYLHRKGSASDYHRIFNPFRYLPLEDGEQARFIEQDEELSKADFKDANLVIFNRHPTIDLEQLIVMKKQYKFKVWNDIDDSWELYEHHYLYDEWKKNKTAELIVKSINIADIVSVTNVRLLRKIAPLNSACKVIHNALPIGHEQFTPKKTESSYLRFMYAGGPSHVSDLETIKDFFDMTTRDLHLIGKSKFILAGYNKSYREKSLHSMNDLMKKTPNYETRNSLPLEKYMDHYNYTDIALAPIENNLFNHYKSNLKVIEAGCMRVPIIAANSFPFLDDSEMENKGVFFCDKPKDWYNIARTFTDYPQTAIIAGNLLYDYVKRKYDLCEINKMRRETINWLKQNS
jgi:hypothetical protein